MDVDAIAVGGTWIRHAPHRSELLGRSAEATDGRWQRASSVRGLYLADDAETAVAEWYRVLAELGLPPSRSVPHDHHVWRLELELADLGDQARLAAVGLGLPRAGAAHVAGVSGRGGDVVARRLAGSPRAERRSPAGRIVCVFDDGALPPVGCRPEERIEISSVPTPPTGMTT